MKSLLKDLIDNKIAFALPSRSEIFIDNSPKGRMSVRLLIERFGIKSINVME